MWPFSETNAAAMRTLKTQSMPNRPRRAARNTFRHGNGKPKLNTASACARNGIVRLDDVPWCFACSRTIADPKERRCYGMGKFSRGTRTHLSHAERSSVMPTYLLRCHRDIKLAFCLRE